jgi:hypothetical protein
MGKTWLGANQRNPSSGTATPIATPTSTSVGAATPRYSWARATRATTALATHLPVWRQRPSGTRPYRTPTRRVARAASCWAGRAQAYQSARKATPNGRGRCTSGASRYWMRKPCTTQATSTTSSWRRRRKTSRAPSSPHSSTVMAVQEPRAARARMPASRPGASSPASQPTTAASMTVTASPGPRQPPAKATTDAAASRAAAISQPTPVVCRWCGSGGGRPEGRRRGQRGIPGGWGTRGW